MCSDVIQHNLTTRQITRRIPQAHKGKVSGVCYASEGRLLSCGVDRTVKLWSVNNSNGEGSSVRPYRNVLHSLPANFCRGLFYRAFIHYPPTSIFTFTPHMAGTTSKYLSRKSCFQVGIHAKAFYVWNLISFTSSAIDHHRSDRLFATASNIVQIWDESKYVLVSGLIIPLTHKSICF